MSRFLVSGFVLLSVLAVAPLAAQSPASPAPRIRTAIDGRRMLTMRGNRHPLARAEFDRGAAPADLPMERMQLVLTRAAEQQTELDALLEQQQDPASPQFHQWLTPQQFGEKFGAADQDIQTVTSWLQSNGFRVDRVAAGRNLIEFSGNAGQVQTTFHTSIHRYMVNGQPHWANASDLQIPAALSAVVAGVATLHNFAKKPQLIYSPASFSATRNALSFTPEFTSSDLVTHALSPNDYAAIYNINSLYSSGLNGTGVSVAVVGRSNINSNDITSFRSTFGLPVNPPQVIVNGRDPGIVRNGEVDEATLDVSWAGAVARNSVIKLVVSASTNTTDGVDLSEAYIIDNNLADVMTESFGACEADYTNAQAAAITSLAQQAAAQGITYAVASGDSGSAGCDSPSAPPATHSPSVNILASTAYNIAVGGTQFTESATASIPYWNTANTSTGQSASGYIPEAVWNESCATVATCPTGYSPSLYAGGGGASALVQKPAWQSLVTGNPADGARDVPDVSLTAAGHDAYLLCINNSCTPNSTGRISFQGYGGTSAATPSFAGIMALVVQKTGIRQGQAAPTLYRLAARQDYAPCNSYLFATVSKACIFYDITAGTNAVPSSPTNSSYPAGPGYDLATGLGSINVANLVSQWTSVGQPAEQIHIYFDSPNGANSILQGLVQFRGWAFAESASVSSVAVAIDNIPSGNAVYGAPRPDVCAVYPGRANCPNVGWTFSFDTTLLTNGPHTVVLSALTSTGQRYTLSSSFTVANWSSANPLHMYIDVPNSQSPVFSGVAVFKGWAVDDLTSISGVSVKVDNVPLPGSATYGASRPDVCAALPGRGGCPNVGWNASIDTSLLADGPHTLSVIATSSGGQSSTIASTFQVANQAGSPITIYLDSPRPGGMPVSGPLNVNGWAVSNSGPISGVFAAIDGEQLITANYGQARPDVCVELPGRAGCPNVGWSFLLDSTQFNDGVHTLTLYAYTGAPNSSSPHLVVNTSFTIVNNGANNPTKIYVDQPAAQTAVFGVTPVSGWAISDSGALSDVAVSVDGVLNGHAAYNQSRPDVCAVYPGRANCPNPGWSYSLDTTLLPNGPHLLQVTASRADTQGLSLSRAAGIPFTVANWSSGNPMRITLDRPAAQSPAASGLLNVSGWAIDDLAPITKVAVSVDGVSFGNAIYGSSRPDVCAAFPNRAGCPNVGWSFALPTTLLADGAHTFEITGTAAGGQASTVASNFTVSNATGSPIIVYVDMPKANATLTGSVQLNGWAIDTGGVAISSVQILMDGVVYGTNYGALRGDVCAVYPSSAGCPNVGWMFTLDSTLFLDGPHLLQIQPLAADGQSRTISVPVKISNGLFR